jgi:hypothetical protein
VKKDYNHTIVTQSKPLYVLKESAMKEKQQSKKAKEM